jgi:hypothetical protein
MCVQMRGPLGGNTNQREELEKPHNRLPILPRRRHPILNKHHLRDLVISVGEEKDYVSLSCFYSNSNVFHDVTTTPRFLFCDVCFRCVALHERSNQIAFCGYGV